jgi:hypothetical protein
MGKEGVMTYLLFAAAHNILVICVKKLLEKMNRDEIMHLLERLKDDLELAAMLKLSEQTFKNWDNEEDSVYDSL